MSDSGNLIHSEAQAKELLEKALKDPSIIEAYAAAERLHNPISQGFKDHDRDLENVISAEFEKQVGSLSPEQQQALRDLKTSIIAEDFPSDRRDALQSMGQQAFQDFAQAAYDRVIAPPSNATVKRSR